MNNTRYELFSKRQKKLQGEAPDVYQYETIPQELRVQIFYIWQKAWGEMYYNDFGELQGEELTKEAYRHIEVTLRENYGVLALGEFDEEENFYEIIRAFLFETADAEKVIDVVEVSFLYIDQKIRDYHDEEIPAFLPEGVSSELSCCIPPDEVIDELNHRFREHRVGYQYESGQIIKMDSEFIHSEAMKPALNLLSDSIYKGANEEFLNAHEHYRKGRYKECLNECLKAFESCLKTICQKRGWPYDSEKDTVNNLIQIVLKNGLIPVFMESHFSGLKSALGSGLSTLRNRKAGHGQGPERVVVPEYVAAYALHLTASNILLLANADKEMK